jgi:hypothetical protein
MPVINSPETYIEALNSNGEKVLTLGNMTQMGSPLNQMSVYYNGKFAFFTFTPGFSHPSPPGYHYHCVYTVVSTSGKVLLTHDYAMDAWIYTVDVDTEMGVMIATGKNLTTNTMHLYTLSFDSYELTEIMPLDEVPKWSARAYSTQEKTLYYYVGDVTASYLMQLNILKKTFAEKLPLQDFPAAFYYDDTTSQLYAFGSDTVKHFMLLSTVNVTDGRRASQIVTFSNVQALNSGTFAFDLQARVFYCALFATGMNFDQVWVEIDTKTNSMTKTARSGSIVVNMAYLLQ